MLTLPELTITAQMLKKLHSLASTPGEKEYYALGFDIISERILMVKTNNPEELKKHEEKIEELTKDIVI